MYFSDVFGVSSELLADENLFDISLVSDLPLFIDPFLIFDSERPEYRSLHGSIIRYMSFVRDKSVARQLTNGERTHWLHFPEIPNNWLGFSIGTNRGRGLGDKFARGAVLGLTGPVKDFGEENFSDGSHVERLFLFSEGNGKDALSDFTTNLCHEYLLKVTEQFARDHLDSSLCREFNVRRVRFDYETERWVNGKFLLPVFNRQYVLLTPIDLLTQSVPWINRPDLFEKFGGMLRSIGNVELRQQVNAFLLQKLAPPPGHPEDKEYRPPNKDVREAYSRALELYPDIANWYVSIKEQNGEEAVRQSQQKVDRAADLFRERVIEFVSATLRPAGFYDLSTDDPQLISVFAQAIATAGEKLFLGEDGLLNDLATEEVKLICTLAWRADGNEARRLPEFRFVYDAKSTSQFESGLSRDKDKSVLVIATEPAKRIRIATIIQSCKLENIHVVSLTGNKREDEKVESVFISYTGDDENWAKWIGSNLMSAGYSVTVQYKDFLPGSNFVQHMDDAVKNTDRTIAVLSKAYLESEFATSEWQAAFRDDPLGHKRKLIPVRVEKVRPKGLLGSIVYADIVGLSEKSATAVLLGAISAEHRPNPDETASFPGKPTESDQYQSFLERVPSTLESGDGNDDPIRRLKVAQAIAALPTDKVNLLVFALNAPDNQIPPMSAAAKDRAAALLDWASKQRIDLAQIENLIDSLSD